MSKVFKKLNLKEQPEILVLNAPESFETELDRLKNVTIHRDLAMMEAVDFALAFVQDEETIAQIARDMAPKARGDAIIWFAYPKMSSKKYTCAINRDTGWEALDTLGFKAVRQVSIDADWSALRFRKKPFVGT